MSRRVSFSHQSDAYPKNGARGRKKPEMLKIWIFKIPKSMSLSPASFIRQIGAKVAGALHKQKRCFRKVSSSASLVRSCSYAEPLDSQRAEAIEDCIEFLNSSSSLQRSYSVASSC